jgi:hypothetical protein
LIRHRRALAHVLPLAFGAVAFLVLGVPVAHAAPLWAVDSLPRLSEWLSWSDTVATCAETLSLVWLLGPPSQSGGEAEACGSLRGVAFAVLGLAAIVMIAIGRMRMATEHKRLEVARRLVEQGIDPPAALLMGPARNDMRRGVVLMFAGVGMFVAGVVGDHRALMAAGLVPEFVGIGYLLSYWLAARSDTDGGLL